MRLAYKLFFWKTSHLAAFLPRFHQRAPTLAAVFLIVGLAALLGANLYRDHRRAVDLTTANCQTLASLLAQQIAAIARNTDITLQSLVDAAENRASRSPEALTMLVEKHRQLLPELSGLYLFNEAGNLVASDSLSRRINVADREYFQWARQNSSSDLIVGHPVLGRLSNSWILPIARRLNEADGQFAGVALATIQLGYLQNFLSTLDLGINGVVALRDEDLHLIVRYPEPESFGVHVGQQPNTPIVWQLVREGRNQAVFGAPSSVDKIERVFVMRRVSSYPFYLFVGQSITDGLREWRHTVWFSAFLWICFSAITAIFATLLNRSWRQRGMALDLAQESTARYESVIAAMSEGVLVENADGRVATFNPAATALVDEPDPQTGCIGWDNPEWSIVTPDGQPFPRDRLSSRVILSGSDIQDSTVIGLTRPGRPLRWVSINARPILHPGEKKPKTAVSVLTDITERMETERELLLAASVYRASGEAIMVLDEASRVISTNPAFTAITGFRAERILGQVPRCLIAPVDRGHCLLDCLRIETNWQGEIWCSRSNGETFPAWATVDVLHDENSGRRCKILIFSDISVRKQAEEQIWHQANYDDLTGLSNRRMLRDRLRQEIRKANRDSSLVALFFVDIDRFKEINDTLGHHYGDHLLKEAALRLRACLRETDTVARVGGDEFAVVLPGLSAADESIRVANQILATLALPFRLGIELAHVSASIGITIFPTDGAEVETLLKNADQSMYKAKDSGRNTYCFFTPDMQRLALERQQLHNDLHAALRSNQFAVHFQPIVELATGAAVKAEALLRWWHSEQKIHVSPALFIPLAEDFGLIGAIGDYSFRGAVDAALNWNRAGLGSLQISVNVSPKQFVNGQGLDEWIDWLHQAGMPPRQVTLEITEGLLLDERPETRKRLKRLREAGMQVAIDDFGTGYSSLAYLKKFELDYLKIDQSFVRGLEHDASDRALVEAMIVMAHKLGLAVIAEGVENTAQRDFLHAAGCDLGQGFHFAKPMPENQFAAYLREQAGTATTAHGLP